MEVANPAQSVPAYLPATELTTTQIGWGGQTGIWISLS